MAYITATGGCYPSTIDSGVLPTIDAMDVHDPEAVRRCAEKVKQSLAARVQEELVGTGCLDRRYAGLRLHGSVLTLERRRRQALAVGALPSAVEVIDLVLAEARRAFDVATSYTPEIETATTAKATPQPWTFVEAPEPAVPLAATVTVEDLLVDLATDATGTGGE